MKLQNDFPFDIFLHAKQGFDNLHNNIQTQDLTSRKPIIKQIHHKLNDDINRTLNKHCNRRIWPGLSLLNLQGFPTKRSNGSIFCHFTTLEFD